MDGVMITEDFLYAVRKNNVIINGICIYSGNVLIPAEVINNFNGKKYKVIGFSRDCAFDHHFSRLAGEISFDKVSEIESISVYMFFISKSIFHLPPKIKRIESGGIDENYLIDRIRFQDCRKIRFFVDDNNRFVSVLSQKNLINNFPLGLSLQISCSSRLSIRETVRIIGCLAFAGSKVIRSVVFPPSVEVIENFSFIKCHNLCSIRFKGKSRLKTIMESAFEEAGISSIIFPSSLEFTGKHAFEKCKQLKRIEFEKGSKLREIGEDSFLNCSNLSYVINIENTNVSIIEPCVFYMTSVESITINQKVLIIRESAFQNRGNLTSIVFMKESRLKEISGNAFSFSGISSIDFPASVGKIGDFSFYQISKLRHLTFAEGSRLKMIGEYAFSGTSIETIDFSPSVEVIGKHGFRKCTRLKSITFPDHSRLKRIGFQCFIDCRELSSVILPGNMKISENFGFNENTY